MKKQEQIGFKVLRAVDPTVLGGTKPLAVDPQPNPGHFPNAPGGLSRVTLGDVRAAAATSSERAKLRFATSA